MLYRPMRMTMQSHKKRHVAYVFRLRKGNPKIKYCQIHYFVLQVNWRSNTDDECQRSTVCPKKKYPL